MSLKSLRESLCKHYVQDLPPDVKHTMNFLISRIDQHRPVGSDGKHGNLHTSTCGCEDKK